jgi:hypothetical protein
MESSYVSSQIKEFNRIRGTAVVPRKTTIDSIKIGTTLGMTEEEIKKGAGNQNAGRTLGSHEKEAGAVSDQHHKKTFQRYRRSRGVLEKEESQTRHGRHMQGSYGTSRYTRCRNLRSRRNKTPR